MGTGKQNVKMLSYNDWHDWQAFHLAGGGGSWLVLMCEWPVARVRLQVSFWRKSDLFSVLAMAILSYRRTNLLEVTNLQAAQVCCLIPVLYRVETVHLITFYSICMQKYSNILEGLINCLSRQENRKEIEYAWRRTVGPKKKTSSDRFAVSLIQRILVEK